MRPICCTCKREMTCIKNGTYVKVAEAYCYVGDTYRCESCCTQIVTGFSGSGGMPYEGECHLDISEETDPDAEIINNFIQFVEGHDVFTRQVILKHVQDVVTAHKLGDKG